MDLGLKGRKALVLGASKGIGLGIASALAAEGVDLLLAARSAEAVEANAQKLASEHGVGVKAKAVDLADPASVAALIGWARDEGEVAILVNNGGGPPPSGALGVPPERWTSHFQSMVASLIAVTDAMVPAMRSNGFGRVLTVASSGVVQPIPTLAVSNTLRASIVAYMKTLAGEVAADGVTVNVLLPGRINTDRLRNLDKARAEKSGESIEDIAKASQAEIPAARYGTVEEFGAVAAFLSGVPAAYVTGSIIRIDGGLIRAVGG
ncbi:SDR family oxidoreductase [Marinivivus vitaminiproducens]|uniref:SDR family oxidoreductase n=1 Tax=Marinivivus vitaminiproducens TaxID=3035935 RepID=UPI0027A3D922|nr:SDR family oxidoreductase [Geminicoccaceae bacterium SCSIO 64248]